MQLDTRTLQFPAGDGPLPAFVARPVAAKEPLPAVIVVQEIWGVDPHIEDVARRIAAAGYVAFAPDLFSRGGMRPAALAHPRLEAAKGFLNSLDHSLWASVIDPQKRGPLMEKLPAADRAPLAETIGALFSPERMAQAPAYLQDLRAAAAFLRAQPFCAGRKVGAVGFCMGGGLALALAVARPDAVAAVAPFYGVIGWPDAAPDYARMTAAVQGHYAEHDDYAAPPASRALEAQLKDLGKEAEFFVYSGTQHAFFNDTRPEVYAADASRQAWDRVIPFFHEHLDA